MRIKLGKTATSRTRAKAKEPVLNSELLILKTKFQQKESSFIDYLLSRGYSSKTTTGYVLDVMRFEIWAEKENISLEAISYNDVLHYIQYKKKKVTQSTISHLVNSLKHYYNYLVFIGNLQHNPTDQIQIKGIQRKKLYDILSKQELENLYHSYELKEDKKNENKNWYKKSELTHKRNKVMIGLLVYQGLNATELNHLMVKDVKLREGKIFIAGTRKSNERELILESVQMLDLMEYVLKTRTELQTQTKKQNDLLFISSGAGNGLNNTLTKLVEQLKKVSSKVTTLKQIRTSVITHWLKTNNLRQVQYMAGHRYVSSTESYLINDLEDLLEDITKFHPIG